MTTPSFVVRRGYVKCPPPTTVGRPRKDSSASSKPPSSDIVKPKRQLPESGRKREKAGQPGYAQHWGRRFYPRRSAWSLALSTTSEEPIIRGPQGDQVSRTAVMADGGGEFGAQVSHSLVKREAGLPVTLDR